MLQPDLSPRDQELLDVGIFAINQAHTEGKITLIEWIRLRREWAARVLEDPDEMIDGAYADSCLDS